MESRALTTGPIGPETPACVGIPFERVMIPSGGRHLDSYVIAAPSSAFGGPAILIFHGVGETISFWVKAQRLLYAHGVSSVVFDYTGSGDRSRPARFGALSEDAGSAYAFARKRFPSARLNGLGHSMGCGILLDAAPGFCPRPEGIIVASAFSSLRGAAARENLLYQALSLVMPDWWNNVRNVSRLDVPLLVVHSDADRVNPVEDGRAIYAAAHEPKGLVILHGFTHNALYKQPPEAWWQPVLQFVKEGEQGRSPAPIVPRN